MAQSITNFLITNNIAVNDHAIRIVKIAIAEGLTRARILINLEFNERNDFPTNEELDLVL